MTDGANGSPRRSLAGLLEKPGVRALVERIWRDDEEEEARVDAAIGIPVDEASVTVYRSAGRTPWRRRNFRTKSSGTAV